MKHGKHEMPHSKKGITVLVALALIFCCSIGGTLAWLATSTDPVTNTFEAAEVPCEVHEKFDGITKSDVTVKNTGNVDAYIRAAIIVNWADAAGNVYGVAPKDSDYSMTLGSDWTQVGDYYYYYNNSVAADASTSKLISSISPVAGKAPKGFKLQVTILAESIQADGLATTAQVAWDAAKN